MKVTNTYIPSFPNLDGSNGRLMAVLVSDEHGGYSCYVAIVNCDPCNENARAAAADHVMSRGSKLNYRQAVGFFPGVVKEEYRL